MAKVNGPLLSLTAKGTLSRALTFSTRRGVSLCKLYSTHKNAKSPSQVILRGYLSLAIYCWTSYDGSKNHWWNEYAHFHGLQMSGMNLFISSYIPFLIQNGGIPPTVINIPPHVS